MNEQEALGKAPIGKLLIKYSVPAILSMVVTSLYNVADRAFIGAIEDVGSLAIAGLGITMPIFTLIVAFGVLIAMGASTHIAIKLGEGHKDEAEKFLGNAFTLALGIAIIVMFIGLLFLDQILILFAASAGTLVYAKEYISVIFLGSIFSILGFTLNAIIRVEGNPKMAARTMIVGCLINLILDPVFIFTFGLGIRGAAIATVITQAIVFIWILSYFLRGKSFLRLKMADLALQKSYIQLIVAVGLAPFAMEIMASMVHVLTNNTLKSYGGDLSIGAMTTVTSIALLFMMPIFGINQGIQAIIGYNYGAKQYDRVKRTILLAIAVATGILTVGFISVQLFPRSFIEIFNKDDELVSFATSGIRIYLSTLPVLGAAIIGPTYFQAIGKVRQSMLLSLLRQFILLVPLIAFLPTRLGLSGVWFAQPIADVGTACITMVFLGLAFKKLKTTQ